MKVELKIPTKNIKKNKKRAVSTIISIALCTFLILATMLTISSIRQGIIENVINRYKNYHFCIENISKSELNRIKEKEYIDKIYIQENSKEQLYEIEKQEKLENIEKNINTYIKYKDVKETCKNSTDIINTLTFSKQEAENKCKFNQKLLTIYGIMNINLESEDKLQYIAFANLSYILDMMILLILIVFSALSIVIIYNAFLITVNERKKEFGILVSIGATEGQIKKMLFYEATILGILGIIVGTIISFLGTEVILKMINNVLKYTNYQFKLFIEVKYIILSVVFIILNIYIAMIIPSIEANNVSVIQSIRNNKQIKSKKRKSELEKIMPIEGKIALKNLKRNKNKYKVITFLLVISMFSYIVISTYINYEKETINIIDEYDVDAKINLKENEDNSNIMDYIVNDNNVAEYLEYRTMKITLGTKQNSVNEFLKEYEDGMKTIDFNIIALDNKTYNKYIEKVNGNYGDAIIYNRIFRPIIQKNSNVIYTYETPFKENNDLKLRAIYDKSESNDYEIIDEEFVNKRIILTNKLIEGYKEINQSRLPVIFTNQDTYENILKKIEIYMQEKNIKHREAYIGYNVHDNSIKIRTNNIIRFSNDIEKIIEENEMEAWADYYTLENQEKVIYIKVLQLILQIMIVTMFTIGITSTMNIINSSIYERKEEFNVLNVIGSTKQNINKILIYEGIIIFLKSAIISILLSIPVIAIIIKYMSNVIVLDKLAIPINSISTFFLSILSIIIIIELYSTKYIKK